MIDTLSTGISAAWREVKPIVTGLGGFGLLAWLRGYHKLALLAGGLLGWVFYFFRDPERFPASTEPQWLVAPADGRVTAVDTVHEPHFIDGPARRISIFLSVFDVHVQRSPCRGAVQLLRYESGSFAPAFLKDTSANENNLIGLLTPHGPVGIRQTAGILARRIVCWVELEDELAMGQRLGLIKFGSRVDLLLPENVDITIQPGQVVKAGETVVARWLA